MVNKPILGAAVLVLAASATATRHAVAKTGVAVEATSSYAPCGISPDLPNADPDANSFISELTRVNTLGFGVTTNFRDGEVYDTDFLDPDLPGAPAGANDTENWDPPGTAISFYHGHGTNIGGAQTTQTCCSTYTDCTDPCPGCAVGLGGFGACVKTPISERAGTGGGLCGSAGGGLCMYSVEPGIVTCGTGDLTHYAPVGYWSSVPGRMALGENATVGAWDDAATNGDTGLAINHMSWGLVPFFPVTEWEQLFAGLDLYAGMMPTWGDTEDSPNFGYAVAHPYSVNAQSAVVADYVDAIASITDGGGCTPGGLSFGGGFNGCGCHFIVTFSESGTGASQIMNESWGALTSEDDFQTGTGWFGWQAGCNYDPTTYPWSGGL